MHVSSIIPWLCWSCHNAPAPTPRTGIALATDFLMPLWKQQPISQEHVFTLGPPGSLTAPSSSHRNCTATTVSVCAIPVCLHSWCCATCKGSTSQTQQLCSPTASQCVMRARPLDVRTSCSYRWTPQRFHLCSVDPKLNCSVDIVVIFSMDESVSLLKRPSKWLQGSWRKLPPVIMPLMSLQQWIPAFMVQAYICP